MRIYSEYQFTTMVEECTFFRDFPKMLTSMMLAVLVVFFTATYVQGYMDNHIIVVMVINFEKLQINK